MPTPAPNAALLMVDLQKGFDEPSWGRRNNPRMEERIADLLAAWRASHRPVIHARHMSTSHTSPLRPGQPGNDYKPEGMPLPGELVIEKRVNSCFIGTSLEADLRRAGYETLVIAGLTTNHCVSTTARMAGNLGFDTWVVSDATATFDRVGPDGVTYRAEQIHAIALADLHGEFATVADTRTVLAAMRAVAVAAALALTSCTTPATRTAVAPEPARAQSGVAAGDVNRSVDPCTNFYEFANGTWRAENPIPPSSPRWSRRLAAREGNRRHVRELLEELAAKKDWPGGSAEQLLGDHYASCLDEAAIEAAGLTPLAPLLAEIDGVRNAADVQRVMLRLHELAIAVPFGVTGAMDYREPSRFIATVVAGGLGLPDRDAYLGAEPRVVETRNRYRAHVARILALAGTPQAQAEKAAAAVVALETRLAGASLDGAAAADLKATDHKMTFAQLEELAPRIEWARYFSETRLPRVDLNVAQPAFLKQVDRELSEEPVATWRAYLTWHLLASASPWLSSAFAEESSRFAGGASDRAERCVELTETLLGDAVGKKYVERRFSPAAKARVEEMIRTLVALLKEDVAGLAWLMPETKKQALAKLAAYDVQVGYPAEWKTYSTVTIRRESLWANIASARRFAVEDNRRRVGKPTQRDLWQLPASSPGAYIDLQLNQIVLPAGFLQPPAFSLEATDAVNYGAIGVGVAHDLTHTFDALGAEVDVAGRPRSWWTDGDRKELEARASCIVEQLEAAEIEPGVHHQGKLVQGEAIAEQAGIGLAYRALAQSMVRRPVPVVDGFTAEQQFFVSFGQYRGEAMRPEAQREAAKTGPHPVPKLRVNAPLANTPEFQQAFSCTAGAAMVRPPEMRCKVW